MRLSALAALAGVLLAASAIALTAGSAGARTSHRAACPSHAQIASLPRRRSAGRLRADVDSRPDTVTVRVARWADGRCAFYLRVSTAKGVHSLPLGHWLGDLGKDQYNAAIRDWQFRTPAVEAIVDLGGRDNLIALGDNEGAANLFVRLVAFDHGRFRWLPVDGEGELSLGGSVMDETEVACSRGGPLRVFGVDNVATRKHPNLWRFSSVTYRRRGWRFVVVAHRPLYGSNAKMFAAAKRAGMPNSPLRGCSLARNPTFDRADGL